MSVDSVCELCFPTCLQSLLMILLPLSTDYAHSLCLLLSICCFCLENSVFAANLQSLLSCNQCVLPQPVSNNLPLPAALPLLITLSAPIRCLCLLLCFCLLCCLCLSLCRRLCLFCTCYANRSLVFLKDDFCVAFTSVYYLVEVKEKREEQMEDKGKESEVVAETEKQAETVAEVEAEPKAEK